MADVRSMLKSQRSARQVRHPHAFYNNKGQLSCSLCKLVLKSDAQWESHLRSEQHASSLKRSRSDILPENDAGVSKKRKASDGDDDESSKRVRSDSIPSRPRTAVKPDHATTVAEDTAYPATKPGIHVDENGEADAAVEQAPAEQDGQFHDELAAFEREMAGLAQAEQQQQRIQDPRKAFDAKASISAQPMTAEELAARDREEKSVQRSARDAGLEEEREEAAGQLQDEVERMNALDDRIKALRARKAALSKGASPAEDLEDKKSEAGPEPDEGNEESDSGDDLDEWAFGR